MGQTRLCLLGPPLLEPLPASGDAFRKKTVALLAYLAVESRPHARDCLAAMFWPESPQDRARGNLRRVLFCIREILGPEAIRAEQDCLYLEPASIRLDISELTSIIGGRDPSTLPLPGLEAAAGLYRDKFMSGFSLPDCPDYDDWQIDQSAGWNELIAAVLEHLFNRYCSENRPADAERVARRLLDFDPLNQNVHRMLMRFYAQYDHPEKAERQYRDCARLLRGELGLGPDRLTRSLRAELAAVRSGSTIRRASGGLPLYDNRFIGRIREKRYVIEHLEHGSGALILTGPGGIGKTRLALESVREFAENRNLKPVFVDLSGIVDPAMVLPLWARAMGWHEPLKAPAAPRGQAGIEDALASMLAAGDSVVILDNLERLMPAADGIEAVLRSCPSAKVVVTSRQALGLSGEKELRLAPLAVPDDIDRLSSTEMLEVEAIGFLADRASALSPALELDRPALERLACLAVRLEGLPLALELVSSRFRYMTPAELAERVGCALALQAAGWSDLPDRQLSLRATIAWSYDTLGSDERRLLEVLSICSGGFCLESAEALWLGLHSSCASVLPREAVPCMLEALVSRSLVERSEAGGLYRFRILDCIREFGLERLAESERDAAGENHARFFLDMAAKKAPACRGKDQMAAFELLDADKPNFDQAFDWYLRRGRADECLRLSAALAWFWYRRGWFSSGSACLESAFRAYASLPSGDGTGVGSQTLIDAGLAHGWLLFVRDAWEDAVRRFEFCAELAMKAGDRGGLSRALVFQGVAERWLGDKAAGMRRCEEGLVQARQSGDLRTIATALVWSYATVGGIGLDDTARLGLEEALCLSRRCGDPWLEAHAQEGLGDFFREGGSPVEAVVYYQAALRGFSSLQDKWMTAWSLEGLGRAELLSGQNDSAIRHLAEGYLNFVALADPENAAYVLVYLGKAEFHGNRREWGTELLGACSSFTRGPRAETRGGHDHEEGGLSETFQQAASDCPEAWTRGCLRSVTEFAKEIRMRYEPVDSEGSSCPPFGVSRIRSWHDSASIK